MIEIDRNNGISLEFPTHYTALGLALGLGSGNDSTVGYTHYSSNPEQHIGCEIDMLTQMLS